MDYSYLKIVKCSGSDQCTLCSSLTSKNNTYTISCECKKYFHKGCLKKWFKEFRLCPICMKQCNHVFKFV